MKKENIKIYGICFLIIYGMISVLCVLNRQPLVFAFQYSLDQFIFLFLLLGALCFALVFVMQILEKLFKKFFASVFVSPILIYAYFILVPVFILFIFTLLSGYVESGFPFLYYYCVTNSCIYLFSGYTVTLIMGAYFARRFSKNEFSKAG